MRSNQILVIIFMVVIVVQVPTFLVVTRRAIHDLVTANNNYADYEINSVPAIATVSKVYFPKSGTPEFEKTCPWVQQQEGRNNNVSQNDRKEQHDCTLLVCPSKIAGEGLSRWVCQVVFAFIIAKQANCRILIDYGDGVELHKLLLPPPSPLPPSYKSDQNMSVVAYDDGYNWTVPKGFKCLKQEKCFLIQGHDSQDIPKEKMLGTKIALMPGYRWLGVRGKTISSNEFPDLIKALPGFDVQTGFACAMGQVFHELSPSILNYVNEPKLFTHILPTVRDSKAFVIAIYIRTMNSENKTSIDLSSLEDGDVQRTIQCALRHEQQKLQEWMATTTTIPRRVVWTVLTDSPRLKDAIVQEYNGIQIILKDNNTNGNTTNATRTASPLKRTVVVTQSRGVHTRKQEPFKIKNGKKEIQLNNISTAVFAEALIDWYLIGESDLVIQNKWTFGVTASLRTNRPIYDAAKCLK